MDILVVLGGVVVGTFLFKMLNSVMGTVYFGFRSMATTWIACVAVGAFITMILGGIMFKLLKWIIVIGVILGGAMLVKNLVSNKATNKE